MIIAELIGGPLNKKQVELDQPHAYELFRLDNSFDGDQEHEQWAYYRIHYQDSGVTNKPAKVDFSSHASRVLAAKPGRSGYTKKHRFTGTVYSRVDARYLFVKVMNETSPCVIARKESLERVVE
jgi:hypothetical protein